MWFFLEYVSYAVYKIDDKHVCILAGAFAGFFIQLIAVIFWDAHKKNKKRE